MKKRRRQHKTREFPESECESVASEMESCTFHQREEYIGSFSQRVCTYIYTLVHRLLVCVRRVCIFSCCKHVSCQSWIYARRCCSDCDSLIKSKENSGGRSCVSFQAVSLWKCWMAAQMVLYFLYYYTLRAPLCPARSLLHQSTKRPQLLDQFDRFPVEKLQRRHVIYILFKTHSPKC